MWPGMALCSWSFCPHIPGAGISSVPYKCYYCVCMAFTAHTWRSEDHFRDHRPPNTFGCVLECWWSGLCDFRLPNHLSGSRCIFKIGVWGTNEMAQWLRALDALKRTWVGFLAPHSGSQLPVNPAPGDLTPFGLWRHLHVTGEYKLTQTHVHLNIKNK